MARSRWPGRTKLACLARWSPACRRTAASTRYSDAVALSRVALKSDWPDNFWINDLQVTSKGAITIGGGAWNAAGATAVRRPAAGRRVAERSGTAGRPGWRDRCAGSRRACDRDRGAHRGQDGSGERFLLRPKPFRWPVTAATAGTDFTPVQGSLNWADGDDSERADRGADPARQVTRSSVRSRSPCALGLTGGGAGLAMTRTHRDHPRRRLPGGDVQLVY